MKLPPPVFGTLIRRYKRFLADVELDEGGSITVHCPNTGRMTTCAGAGWRVALSDSGNPKRKHRFTWELVHNGTCWICVNTGRANQAAAEALRAGVIPDLSGYCDVLREQRFGESRFDLMLKRNADSESPADRCYVEVKNVTLLADDGCYAFPDAVTERGRKHLHELVRAVQAGHRAAMLYVIPRSDGTAFRAAAEIDPKYADALQAAESAGVEIHAWRAEVAPKRMELAEPVAYSRR